MAVLHNCSKGWLSTHAFRPFLVVLGTGLVIASVIGAMYWHASATRNGLALLAVLWLVWYSVRNVGALGRLATHITRTYRTGWCGEWIVRRALMQLPDDFHVFYDVQWNEGEGNTDFIVVCPAGIYTVEVKNHANGVRKSRWHSKEKHQAMDEARDLHSVLKAHGFDQWVTSVLVRADQKSMSHKIEGNVDLLGRGDIAEYFEGRTQHHGVRLSDEHVSAVVSLLDRTAHCHTHRVPTTPNATHSA
jgi:hypothetical protein